jgi:hypothetical protein
MVLKKKARQNLEERLGALVRNGLEKPGARLLWPMRPTPRIPSLALCSLTADQGWRHHCGMRGRAEGAISTARLVTHCLIGSTRRPLFGTWILMQRLPRATVSSLHCSAHWSPVEGRPLPSSSHGSVAWSISRQIRGQIGRSSFFGSSVTRRPSLRGQWAESAASHGGLGPPNMGNAGGGEQLENQPGLRQGLTPSPPNASTIRAKSLALQAAAPPTAHSRHPALPCPLIGPGPVTPQPTPRSRHVVRQAQAASIHLTSALPSSHADGVEATNLPGRDEENNRRVIVH